MKSRPQNNISKTHIHIYKITYDVRGSREFIIKNELIDLDLFETRDKNDETPCFVHKSLISRFFIDM